MARLNPFSKVSPRADEIIRQCVAKRERLATLKRHAKECFYHDLDSLIGAFIFEDIYGYEQKIEYEIFEINLSSATYRVRGLETEKDGKWLVPVVRVSWNGLECLKTRSLERLLEFKNIKFTYSIYYAQDPNFVTRAEMRESAYAKSHSIDIEQEKRFYDWADSFEILHSHGLKANWNIDKYLFAQIKKYFAINETKCQIHPMLIERGYVPESISEIKFYKNNCYIKFYDYSEWTTENLQSLTITTKEIQEFLKTNNNQYDGKIKPALDTSRLKAMRDKLDKSLDYAFYPYYYYEVFQKPEPTESDYNQTERQLNWRIDPSSYLLSNSNCWFHVQRPKHSNHSIQFPPADKYLLVSFAVGDNWQGTWDLDYYHAIFARDQNYVEDHSIRPEYASGLDYVWNYDNTDPTDLDSILFTRSYKEQLRKESDPDYSPSGRGFAKKDDKDGTDSLAA